MNAGGTIGFVVVAIDDREGSLDALRLAGLIAERTGARLGVATVLEYARMPIDIGMDYEEVVEEHFERRFATAAAKLGRDDFDRFPMHGRSPARCLTELAEDEVPDLLILGSSHRKRWGRVVSGSTADRLMTGAPCAVAIAPQGLARARASFSRIGVAYAGAEESSATLPWADALAASTGAEVELIGVAHPQELLPGRSAPTGAAYHELLRRDIVDALGKACASIRESVHCSRVVLDGDPAETLTARSADLDLLVLGSRSYGPLRRVLLGSVSKHVVREARCAVLVVPRAENQPDLADRAERAVGRIPII